ncbi:MAG TPA: phytanoyl-CoA dioxygenase family protein [Croceibacterium sp.]|nr:phytanoyl-CoA dioxygenase family protein [Propylenella sp.]HYD25159.1 phytanoyl-CoA dioxygenase family protein [Croceibacterium sp.]
MQSLASVGRSLFLKAVPARTAQRLQFALKEPSRSRGIRWTGDETKDSILRRVDRDGFAVVPGYLTAAQCAQARADFDTARLTHSAFVHRREDERLFGMENVSPIARRFIDDPLWIELADAYSGEANCSLFVMANRVVPRGEPYGSGGGWHRDCFARELKAMVYLTDVREDNGPFQIIRRSHGSEAILSDIGRAGLRALQNRIDDDQAHRLAAGGRQRTICAHAGTAIVFDTSSVHCGAPIAAGQRYALTNYLCASRHMARRRTLEHYAPLLATA